MSSMQKFLKIALVAAITVSTSAIYVSKDHPDGTFIHYIDHYGKDVIRRIDGSSVARRFAFDEASQNLNATFMEGRASGVDVHGKRNNPSVGANCSGCSGGELIPSDTDSANSAIDTQCGSGDEVAAGADYYSKIGGTVAYVCAYQQQYTCTAADRQSVSAEITSNCGAYEGGWNTPLGFCQYGENGIVYGYQPVDSCFCFC